MRRRAVLERYDRFGIRHEKWTSYSLGDGGRLRLRWELLKIRTTENGDGTSRSNFIGNCAVVSEATNELRAAAVAVKGPVDPTTKVIQDGVGFKLKERGESVYELSSGALLTATPTLKSVRRTSIMTPDGDPFYIVEYGVDLQLGQGTPRKRSWFSRD